MNKKYFLPIIFFHLIICSALFAGDDETSDSLKSPVAILPFGFYTPETSVALGGAVVYYFRETGSNLQSKPSRLAVTTFYTFKNQYRILLAPKFYINKEKYFLDLKLWFTKFPDKFFGVGNDTRKDNEEFYTPQLFKIQAIFENRFFTNFYAGVIGIFSNTKIIKKAGGGLLDTGNFLGSDGGNSVGLGWILVNDTRDNIINSTSGAYDQIIAVYYSDALGGDFNFNKYTFDIRNFFMVNHKDVIAIQTYAEIIGGSPPFDELARLGGKNNMRGYYLGRFRDKNYITAQVEYRMPLWGKFGMIGFSGVGDVANKFSDFRLQDLKYSVGLGLRYMIIEKERANVRIDFGFGSTGFGFYVDYAETF